MLPDHPKRTIIRIDPRKPPRFPRMGDYREDREKYRCFCGFLHIKTATWIIWALCLLSLVWSIYRSNYDETKFKDVTLMNSVEFAEVILMTFALTMLLCGLIAERPSFLVPFLIIQVIKVVGYILTIILFVLERFFNVFGPDDKKIFDVDKQKRNATLTSEEKEDEDWVNEHPNVVGGVTVGIYLIFLLIALISLWVVWKCRKYFQDLQRHSQRQTTITSYSPNTYSSYR